MNKFSIKTVINIIIIIISGSSSTYTQCYECRTSHWNRRATDSITVIGTLAVDGWAVTFGTARKGLGRAAARPGPSSLYHPSTAMYQLHIIWFQHITNLLFPWNAEASTPAAAVLVRRTILSFFLSNLSVASPASVAKYSINSHEQMPIFTRLIIQTTGPTTEFICVINKEWSREQTRWL